MGNEQVDRRGIKFVVVNDSHSPRFCVKERKQQQRDYLKISYLTFSRIVCCRERKKKGGKVEDSNLDDGCLSRQMD